MSSNDDEKKHFSHVSEQESSDKNKADNQQEQSMYVYETPHKHIHDHQKKDHAHKESFSIDHKTTSHHHKADDHIDDNNKANHHEAMHHKTTHHKTLHSQSGHIKDDLKSTEKSSDLEHDQKVDENIQLDDKDDILLSEKKDEKYSDDTQHDVLKESNDSSQVDGKKQSKSETKTKRSSIIRNPLIILANFALTLIVLGIIVCVVHFYTDRAAFEDAGLNQEAKTILIRSGAGVGEIATILERENIISRGQAFKSGVSYYDQTNKLKAGEYEIPAHASMHQVMDILCSGKSIEYSLTIPEGLTVQQAVYRIRDNDVLTGDLPTKIPVEGSLLADTVRFTRGTTRKEILRRLEDGQKKLIQSIWDKRSPDVPVKNINEFVTLASIVEKETGIASERPMVAGVFTNRLKQNMRLDSDPTFLYGIYGGEGKPANTSVTRDDRLSDTPYNTYRMKGLPPTPIAIPGRGALEAVANPAKTDALFFVADGTGGHIFAKTLDEHNTNVAKWREFRANQ